MHPILHRPVIDVVDTETQLSMLLGPLLKLLVERSQQRLSLQTGDRSAPDPYFAPRLRRPSPAVRGR
ncbi:hypothetical protein CKJ57_18120 [Mycobacterium intracellulare subsp. chimaera]|nr:hypothetical protein CKJ57_18120 [Mycobacterium intracellulare subsp. chimaera]